MSKFRPMLSGKAPDNLTKIKYPVMVSPKLDGIRAMVIDSDNGPVVVSRRLKPIPNLFIQSLLAHREYIGLDGELIVGAPNATNTWNNSNSGVMSKDGEPDFVYYVFDDFTLKDKPFVERYGSLDTRFDEGQYGAAFELVLHQTVQSPDVLRDMFCHFINDGYEGVMIRSLTGPYKFGRATTKEGSLLKVKLFDDAEAKIIGVKERMHNANEATTNALGLTERSTKKENKSGRGDLGAFICIWNDVEFDIGTGFTDEQRSLYWEDFHNGLLDNAIVKFKYQGLTPDGKPRFPVFLGFRDEIDI